MKKLSLLYAAWLLLLGFFAGLAVWLYAGSHPIGALYALLGACATAGVILWQLNRHFRLFKRLLQSIADEDFSSLGFPANAFSERFAYDLNRAFDQYKAREAANQTLRLSYETLLDKTDTAFLMLLPDGRVDWMNRSALLTLGRLDKLKEADTLCEGFSDAVTRGKEGETFVMAFQRHEVPYQMAVGISLLNDRKIITLQNISSVLETNELLAWQRLISVLTHEMMNSLTPIISLSDTLIDRVQEPEARKALETIRRRSVGLQEFVQNYRKITRVPLPVKVPIQLDAFLGQLASMFAEGTLAYQADACHLRLHADRNQLEQVFLNLINNALEAGATAPIEITACIHPFSGHVVIQVKDNGPGIEANVMDQIFIPFFSTKPFGSGIGLSLCKQIVSLHGGSLTVSSQVGHGSCFRLVLPISF